MKFPKMFFEPARREKDQGGQVQFKQKESWAVIAELNTPGTAATGYARIITPTRRLSAMVEVFYIQGAYNGFLVTDYAATWTLDAQALSPTGNNYIDLHQVLGTTAGSTTAEKNAPNAYELDSAIRALKLTLTTTNQPLLSSGSRVAGRWFVRARWEPNTPMDNDELETLFSNCQLSTTKITT